VCVCLLGIEANTEEQIVNLIGLKSILVLSLSFRMSLICVPFLVISSMSTMGSEAMFLSRSSTYDRLDAGVAVSAERYNSYWVMLL